MTQMQVDTKISVTITDDMKRIAEKVEAYFDERFRDRPNYTGLKAERRFYWGMIGELAFYTVLKSYGKQAELIHDLAKGDNGDFTVYGALGPKIIDVKTCSQKFHKYLAVPTEQYEKVCKGKVDYYVAIQIKGDEAIVAGWCTDEDFETLPTPPLKVPSVGQHLEWLEPIDNLLTILNDGKTIGKLPDWAVS